MSDDGSAKHPEKVRGTLSLTHKQAALTLTGLMALTQWQDIKVAITGETDKNVMRLEQAQKEGVIEIKGEIRAMKDELITIQRRVKDQTWEEMAKVERRCESRDTEIVARIGNLEVYAFKIKARPGT